MRRKQRLALGPRRQGSWPGEGRSFYRLVGENRPHDESAAIAEGKAFAMDATGQLFKRQT
jgi:hypothetical protein